MLEILLLRIMFTDTNSGLGSQIGSQNRSRRLVVLRTVCIETLLNLLWNAGAYPDMLGNSGMRRTFVIVLEHQPTIKKVFKIFITSSRHIILVLRTSYLHEQTVP
jgi:hypothetical protein